MFEELLEALVELPDAALDDRIRSLELERRRVDAELAAATRVAEQRQLGADDGHRTINAYLRATINCSSNEASRLRSLGRAIDHVDGLGDVWMTGRIGASQAQRFATLYGNRRVRQRLGEFAPLLLDDAEHLSYRDFSACVDRFEAGADPDGAHDARDDAVEHRDAHVSHVAGSLVVDAHGGDGLTTAELMAIHQRFVDAEFQIDLAARRSVHGDAAELHPLPRTAGQRRFDALVEIFRRAHDTTEAGTRSDALVNIVIDDRQWAKLLAQAGLAPTTDFDGRPIDPFTGLPRTTDLLDQMLSVDDLHELRCETTTGVQLHPHDVLRAALAGHVRRVVVDSSGVAVDMGRKRRLFEGPARDAAVLLLRRCEHPGCDLPAEWCDTDHAIEWSEGGTTDQPNARIRCGTHNTAKTRQRWRSRRSASGRTYTVRADGTIMLPVGVRPPLLYDDDDPTSERASNTSSSNESKPSAPPDPTAR